MSDLSDKMRVLADSGHPRAEELRIKATEFDEKNAAYGACTDLCEDTTTKMKSMLGAWARARRCWSECSGEPLI